MDNNQATRNQGRLNGEDGINMFNGFKSLIHNLIVELLMFMEPILNMWASFIDLGRHLLDSLIQWIQMCLESVVQHGKEASIRKRRVRSRDLKSVQFLGQGFSGFINEITWSTWYGKERLGRFAQKNFPRLESTVFEKETARLVNLHHPNVVEVFCWTVDKLGCSLVMEFVNTDLESIVEKRKEAQRKVSASKDPGEVVNGSTSPFELTEAIYIMLHIASAMEYLHSLGVGHGDLRPNNILIDLDAVPMIVKVVDFGLTESKKRTTLVSKRAQFVRTLEWKAPEIWKDLSTFLLDSPDEYMWEEMDTAQVEGNESVANKRAADVYSFAVTCTYILGGTVSYPKSSLSGLQQRISSGTLRPEIPSTCPTPLKMLIESSWDPDSGRRPTFSYLQEQLEILQLEEPLEILQLEEPLEILQLEEPLEILQLEEPLEILQLEEPLEILQLEEPLPILQLEEPLRILQLEEPLRILQLEEPLQILQLEEPLQILQLEEPLQILQLEEPLQILQLEEPDPIQRLQPELVFRSLSSDWPVYENMDYLGVEEENQELLDAQQNMEEEEQEEEVEEENQEVLDAQQNMEEEEQEEEVKEEMLMDNDKLHDLQKQRHDHRLKEYIRNGFSTSLDYDPYNIGLQ